MKKYFLFIVGVLVFYTVVLIALPDDKLCRAEEHMAHLLAIQSHPEMVNRFRRNIHPSCMKNRQLVRAFGDLLWKRRSDTHYNLHIPRSGGTSFCKAFRDHYGTELTPPEWYNCWLPSMWPMWFFYPASDPSWPYNISLTCSELHQTGYKMIANERWMDTTFCPGITYSIMMRDPYSRFESMLDHTATNKWLLNPHTNYRMDFEGYHGRQELFPNYLTWSLTAGFSRDPLHALPTFADIQRAKHVLSGFDFIVDLSNEKCSRLQLMFVGIDKCKLQRVNTRDVKGYVQPYAPQVLDYMLYEYAQVLMERDCRFLEAYTKI